MPHIIYITFTFHMIRTLYKSTFQIEYRFAGIETFANSFSSFCCRHLRHCRCASFRGEIRWVTHTEFRIANVIYIAFWMASFFHLIQFSFPPHPSPITLRYSISVSHLVKSGCCCWFSFTGHIVCAHFLCAVDNWNYHCNLLMQ